MSSKPWNPSELDRKSTDPVWVLDPTLLDVGDVILSTTSNWMSNGIRLFTNSDFSHAALHVGGGFLIEAVGAGVRRIHARAFVYPDESYVSVLRANHLSDDLRERVSASARAHLYRPYSIARALATKVKFVRANEDPGRFCSQLVAEAYESVECRLLSKNSAAITPGDLTNSDLLKPVSAAVIRRATKQAVIHALGEMEPTWKLGKIVGNNATLKPTSDEVHLALLGVVDDAISKSGRFARPYHYFDVLRQLSSEFEELPHLVTDLDSMLVAALREFDVTASGVEPQSTIPGLISDTADPSLVYIVDRGPTEESGEETMRLRDEILYGRNWDEREWESMINEFKAEYERTKLLSLGLTMFWLMGDLGKVQTTYRWLAMQN